MQLRDHAIQELRTLGYPVDELERGDIDADMAGAVLELIDTFSSQGHSGSSASYCINLFNKLAQYEPLAPLRGTDDEWVEVSDDLWQNKRCSHVFKTSEGAYDINGRIFREPNGSCYTNIDSRVDVTFPYTPTREYVDREASSDE